MQVASKFLLLPQEAQKIWTVKFQSSWNPSVLQGKYEQVLTPQICRLLSFDSLGRPKH